MFKNKLIELSNKIIKQRVLDTKNNIILKPIPPNNK